MFWNKYPSTDMHELNLDWILVEIKKLHSEWSDFKILNSIRFYGEHDITKGYPAWSLVSHDNIGYISTQIVPAGIDLDNIDYWKPIADYSALLADIQERIVKIEGKQYYTTPEEYGAYRDGLHDDTEAFKKALSDEKQIIMLSEGDYLVSENLEIPSNTIIHGHNSNINYTGSNYCLSAISENNIFIDGVNINCNDNQVRAIFFDKCSNISVRNCDISNYRYGIYISNSHDVIVDNNKCVNGSLYGITIAYNDSNYQCEHITITNNITNHNHQTIEVSPSVLGTGIHLVGNARNKPYFYIKNVLIDNNISCYNAEDGITLIGVEKCIVSHNICNNNIYNTEGSGIGVSEGCMYINVNNNVTCDNKADGIVADVATFVGGEAVNFGYVEIVGNISNNNTSGIRNNNTPHTSIINNQIHNSKAYGIMLVNNGIDNIISNNTIINSAFNNIRLSGESADVNYAKKVIISNNILRGITYQELSYDYASLYIDNYTLVEIINNIIESERFAYVYRCNANNKNCESISVDNIIIGRMLVAYSEIFRKWNDDLSKCIAISSFDTGILDNAINAELRNNERLNFFGLTTYPVIPIGDVTVNTIQNAPKGTVVNIINLGVDRITLLGGTIEGRTSKQILYNGSTWILIS